MSLLFNHISCDCQMFYCSYQYCWKCRFTLYFDVLIGIWENLITERQTVLIQIKSTILVVSPRKWALQLHFLKRVSNWLAYVRCTLVLRFVKRAVSDHYHIKWSVQSLYIVQLSILFCLSGSWNVIRCNRKLNTACRC